MYQDYEKIKSELQNQLQSYYSNELYDFKKLNEGDEAENILVMRNTVFLGNNKMQIKKIDGTIEKYNVEKYYPVDEKDEMIKKLNQKVEELERRLNDEPTKHTIANREFDKSSTNDNEYVEPNAKTNSEPIQE